MNRSFLAVALTACLLGCISDVGEARFRGMYERFEPCAPYCSAELTHDRGTIRLTLRDDADVVVADNTGSLTEEGRASLTRLESALTEAAGSLTTSECADCDRTIEIGWVEGRLVRYDAGASLPALAELDDFGVGLREALATCTATSDVMLDASCTPSL